MNVLLSTYAIFEAPDSLANPASWYNAMVLPSMILIFGAIFYLGGRFSDLRTGKQTPTRFAGMILTAIALYLGFLRFIWTTDLMYGQLVRTNGKKYLAAHYAAFILPVIGVGIIIFFEWWDRKQREFIQ